MTAVVYYILYTAFGSIETPVRGELTSNLVPTSLLHVHVYSSLFIFICYFVLFNSCCFHTQVLWTTLLQEFPILYSQMIRTASVIGFALVSRIIVISRLFNVIRIVVVVRPLA